LGLFSKNSDNDSDKQPKTEEKEFASVIIDTRNIADELKSVASSHNLDPKELSFKVLKVTTSYREKKGEEFKDVSEKDKSIFDDNDFMLNPDLKILQHYKVEIFKKSDEEHDDVIPEIMLSGNKSLTKVVATVKKNLDVKYFSKLAAKMIEDINTKKVRSNILVGIRDENMHKEIKKIVSSIRVKNFLEADHMFVVCQGLDKVPSIDDKIIYHYKNKVKAKDGQDRVNYARRGFILAVAKDEVIIEYIKPQTGIPGRNCQGRYLSVKKPSENHKEDIKHTENIIKKEDNDRILYIANKNGYVNFDGGTYDIQDKMEIESVDFKSTGSIETDLNADVKINIKESDIFKDAIGPGMSVETSELHVEGNIASGASIRARILEIKGQTHKTATIEADKAMIAVHRGSVTGKDIEIDRLEGGYVNGDTVKVRSVIGGEIVGRNIYIEELTSNASIRASELIDIKKVKGNNNKLVIDPTVTKQYSQKIEDIKEEINKLNISIKPMPKILEAKKRTIEANRGVIEDIKHKIIELKNDGKTPPASLLGKIKEYQKMVNEYNRILKDFKETKHRISYLNESLQSAQDQIFSAKIVNHGTWKEFNEVKFKLIYPPIEVTYNTKDGEVIREITLNKMNDEDFEIKRSGEYS
jgi:hypothetical protein